MRNKVLLSLVLAAVACSGLVGCGPKKPDGFPEVVPFKVIVVDGSTPIQDVAVFFISEKSNAVVAGTTDASGVAVMKTRVGNNAYVADGAPAGEYRVTCTKDPLAPHWKTAQERAEMSIEEQGVYNKEWQAKCEELPREIPKIWSDFDKTPLKASVSASSSEVTYDVEGKASK